MPPGPGRGRQEDGRRAAGRSATRRRDRSGAWLPGLGIRGCVVMGPMVLYLSTDCKGQVNSRGAGFVPDTGPELRQKFGGPADGGPGRAVAWGLVRAEDRIRESAGEAKVRLSGRRGDPPWLTASG